MSKAILFCADGTWNGPGEPDADNTASPPTNVFKLFLNIAGDDLPGTMMLAKEQERVLARPDGSVLQWTKYLHGVGDSDNKLVQALAGVVGAGLIARIVRGYTFISRNYLDGDLIYIVGFSRGAYTARALAGLIAAKGLLDATKTDLSDRDKAYQLGAAVWYAYRQQVAASKAGWTAKLVSISDLWPNFMHQSVPANLLTKANIEAVGVWDTVGSLGIPDYTRQDSRLDTFQFADTVLSPVVKHGVHAVAADERRADFTPTLWDPDGRITQTLFVGCHSDVGGGFVSPGIESGLSDCGLLWMTEQLFALGVAFLAPPAVSLNPNARGTAHEPWASGLWRFLPQGPRQFPGGLWLSQEVVDRAAAGPVIPDPTLPAAAYAPESLKAYLVDGLPAEGVIVA